METFRQTFGNGISTHSNSGSIPECCQSEITTDKLETQEVSKPESQGTETKTDTHVTESKIFTQAQVDEIVKNRLDREKKNQPSKEELKLFQEWKKSQQTEQEKFAEMTKQFEDLKKENQVLKVKNEVRKANINEMFEEFVIDKLLKQEGDFNDNLKAFKASNPQFFNSVSSKVSTTPNLTGTKLSEQKPKKLIEYF